MIRFFILGLLFFSLSACQSNPTYKRHDLTATATPLKAEDVNFRLDDALFQHAPTCVMILPSQHRDTDLAATVSRALARYAGEKIQTVHFPRHIHALERHYGLDLQIETDQRRAAQLLSCSYSLHAEIYDQGDEHLGIAARKYLGLKLTLRTLDPHSPILWEAMHTVWRGDGAIPLSPLSVLGGVASATLFNQDDAIMLDLVDRALRRMIRTLPNVS